MAQIECPQSVFATVESNPGAIIGCIMLTLASIPLMATGLFFAFFGAGVKTVLVAMQAFVLIGFPLLAPTITMVGRHHVTILHRTNHGTNPY